MISNTKSVQLFQCVYIQRKQSTPKAAAGVPSGQTLDFFAVSKELANTKQNAEVIEESHIKPHKQTSKSQMSQCTGCQFG